MKKYRLPIKKTTWYLFEESTGWVIVKYGVDKGLSRTQFRAMDKEAALQYIFSTYNGNINPLHIDDLEFIDEVKF